MGTLTTLWLFGMNTIGIDMNFSGYTKVLNAILLPKIERDLGMTYVKFKENLLENIAEYKKLTNRHWKHKRELESYICSEVISLEEFIKNMDVPDETPSERKRK